jgi:hypothetical protein
MARELRPIIHIGYYKTGTTWFQNRFYPLITNFNYIPQLRVIDTLGQVNLLDFEPSAVRAALGIGPDRPAIICDESLCGHYLERGPFGASSRGFAELMQAILPDAEIVIAIRSQPDLLASLYGTHLRSGGRRHPDAYWRPGPNTNARDFREAQTIRPNPAFFEFDRLIALYDSLFGRDRVHVFAYEQFRSAPQETIGQMKQRFGFDFASDPATAIHENRAFGRRLFPLMHLFNTWVRDSHGDNRPILEIPGWFGFSRLILRLLNRTGLAGLPHTPESLFGAETVKRIRLHYGPSNRRLQALRPLPLAELGYPVTDQDRGGSEA